MIHILKGLVLSSPVANLVHLCGEDVGSNPAWTISVKSFAPYLGGRRGQVPSDSLGKFLQEVNLYNWFKLFFDTHIKLHRKETCRDCYITLAVLVKLYVLQKPRIFLFKSAESNFVR